MRILTVVYDLDVGGTQRAAVTFANAYARMGHDSRILVTRERGPRERELDWRVTVLDFKHRNALLSDWQPEMVHLHSHGLSEGEVRDLRSVVDGDAIWVEQNVFASTTPWTDHLDCSFVFSRWCEHQYALSPGQGALVALVPNPIDPTGFFRDTEAGARLRAEYGVRSDAIILGRVGQPQDYKWSPMLVKAFEVWAQREPRAWLLLVGAPDEVADQVRASRFRERIVLVERVEGDEALRAHYSAMDLFGHSARQGETFGYVLAEAALCEVPIITLSTPWADNSQAEVVGHGVGGFVVTSGRGFTSAVCALGADASLRGRLGRAGRARMLAQYEATSVASRALRCREVRDVARPLSRSEISELYSIAMDPPAGVRRIAARRQSGDLLAWMSGAESIGWLAQRTLNRWGVSRYGFTRASGRPV